jgi:DNA-binding SARP family transcriptional activator
MGSLGSRTRSGASSGGPVVSVLGGFSLTAEGVGVVRLPSSAQRVLGYLALTGVGQRRDVLAGRLWSTATQDRAHANLRTAVWKVRQLLPEVIDCRRDTVGLQPGVSVDYAGMTRLAGRLLHRQLSGDELLDVPSELLAADLLPGWDEDWLLIDRERHRQLRMHALEALSNQLTDLGEFALAIQSAYAAIAIEPLGESATHALIRACLAEGNRTEALRQFSLFQRLLADETGLRPSDGLVELIGPVRRPGHRRGAAVAG